VTFNTYRPTQIAEEHKAILEHPEMDHMMTREEIMRLLSIESQTLFLWIRSGRFPKPDLQVSNGPTAVRRWYYTTVFDWMKENKPKPREDAA